MEPDLVPRKLSYAAFALAAVWFGRTYFEVAEAKRVERRSRPPGCGPELPSESVPDEGALPIYLWLAPSGQSS